MSGPDYPPDPGAGSNGIGEFAIGVSQIGDIPPFDYFDTIISQYANSPIITSLIANFFQYVDQTKNVLSFYDLVMNLDTAQGYALDCWGRIVGVSRTLQITVGKYFGFNEATRISADPFGQSAFYSGQTLTSNYNLSDNFYRTLIFAKAMANISNGSIPSINAMLLSLFPNRGNCYVTEGVLHGSYFGFAEAVNASGFNQDAFYNGESVPRMTMQYVFTFQLSAVEIAIVEQSGVLPKPTGVLATTVIL